jgi:hypothetical protein
MTKLKARDALKAEIAKQTNQLADGRILKDGTVSFEWFVRNRYPVTPAARASRHYGERVHAGGSGECAADGWDGLRDAHISDDTAAGRVGLSREKPAQLMPAGKVWHQMASSLSGQCL